MVFRLRICYDNGMLQCLHLCIPEDLYISGIRKNRCIGYLDNPDILGIDYVGPQIVPRFSRKEFKGVLQGMYRDEFGTGIPDIDQLGKTQGIRDGFPALLIGQADLLIVDHPVESVHGTNVFVQRELNL